ncbi:helix-turn-helix domain-containing protein [Chryseobacterium sediminis]|uniref:helix-turn-helix domain-containing protein n=1 Tax=Chryseobacterium sediminis TaxID=1679494 RepID=UPI00142EAD01|nr:helix-turn-helix transcriptional regulator [Chryseobacterium sediminis]
MEIHKRIKSIREIKEISQDAIAFELDLHQSQYSRREKGDIPFSVNEIEKIAAFLGVRVSELYGEELFQNSLESDKMASGSHGIISCKLLEQFEILMKEKEAVIAMLKERIEALKKK